MVLTALCGCVVCCHYCLSQYGEITSCRYLTRTLCSSLPGLSGLTSLNIAHIATDNLAFTISRYLTQLVSLDMSNSSVSDRAIKYLAGRILDIENKSICYISSVSGTGSITQVVRPPPSSSVIRNLTELLDSNSNSRVFGSNPGSNICQTKQVFRQKSCPTKKKIAQKC